MGAGEIRRQCRDRLFPYERSAHRIVVEDGNRRRQLRENVCVLSIGMGGHVTCSGTGRDRRKWHDVGDELASVCIEVPHVYLVGAESEATHVIACQFGTYLVALRLIMAL